MPWSSVDTKYSIQRVKCTPSTAYTEYSIHRVQHTPSTASIEDCLSSHHSHDYESTAKCSFSCRCASRHDTLPSASAPRELNGESTLSHSRVCESTNRWWSLTTRRAVHRSPPGSGWNSLNHGRTSVSPISLEYGLRVRMIMASKCFHTRAW